LNTTVRLQLATRIHLDLLRHLGESVDVDKMLQDEQEAREVVWVCEALGDVELQSLARQFAETNVAPTLAAAPSHGAALPARAGSSAVKDWFQPARWMLRNPR
jgi:hypothetical protein